MVYQYLRFVPAVLCGVHFMGQGIFGSKDNKSNRIGHKIYPLHVNAATQGSKDLQCNFTPKVCLMLEHVEQQMRNIWGGVR